MRLRKRSNCAMRPLQVIDENGCECEREVECDVWEDSDGNEVGYSPKGSVLDVQIKPAETERNAVLQKIRELKSKTIPPEERISALEGIVETLIKHLPD